MGTLYAIACDALAEKIVPSSVNGERGKLDSIGHLEHPVGSLVLFTMWRLWDFNPVTMVTDNAIEDPVTGLQPYDDYKDITKDAIEAYNDYYGSDLQYTP